MCYSVVRIHVGSPDCKVIPDIGAYLSGIIIHTCLSCKDVAQAGRSERNPSDNWGLLD